MKRYDVVLLYTLSRVHNHYLPIVRELGRRLRIAVVVADTKKKIKTAATERLFLDLAEGFGADVIEPGRVDGRLLLVPQFRYQDGFLASLDGVVRAERRIALQTFGHGVENLAPLAEIGIDRFFVYDRRVFENKYRTPDERRWVEERFELVEMGSPVARYPVFPDVRMDWLVAFPTELSFPTTAHKIWFSRNIERLLDQVPAGDRVVLKLHNVSDGGRLIERSSRAFRAGEAIGRRGWDVPLVTGPGRPGEWIARAAFGAAYGRIARRVDPLSALTTAFNLGLELFLPGVTNGLVTGRSSVVWYALLHRLPVYNCDDETVLARGDGVTDSYRAFGVPPCGGRLTFDPAQFERISPSAREANLIDLVQKEL